MNEDLLHYVWKFQLFNHNNLKLTSGEDIEIIKPGSHNFDSGPDFFNGQIKIDQTTWAGNVEIHTLSSHWFLHNHQSNEAYDKIILHVVWQDDKPVKQSNGYLIPTIELKGLVSKSVIEKYEDLKKSKVWIPCENEIDKVDSIVVQQAKNRTLIERLERKTDRILQVLSLTNNDWEETFYHFLAKYFGFKTNAVPFELLATSAEFKIIRKLQANSTQLLALLFGQAGFLNSELKDAYPSELKKEYDFLKRKFQLKPLEVSLWKFMRMRPSNFPTIRIAQFGAIYLKNSQLFQSILEADSISELVKLFEVKSDNYWENHFRFDVVSKQKSTKNLGRSSINLLIINVVTPFLFIYGKKVGNEEYVEKSFKFLENLPAEKNSIIKKWNALGVNTESSFDSQALIQLKNEYCDPKKCLNCAIGNFILKQA